MLKSKIARKLSRNFTVVLLAFALIVGSVFFFLFRSYTVERNKIELENYGQSLVDSLLAESGTLGKGMGGYGAYLRFISEVSDTEVWVVDENMNLITAGKGKGGRYGGYSMTELPANAKEVIDEVLTGKTVNSKGFSDVLSTLTLTVGVPIQTKKGDIIGAVLLHSPVDGTMASMERGLIVLAISILVALIASVLLSLGMSASFTKPLSKMKRATNSMMQGDYTVRCGVEQKDEIGELSADLDLLALRLDEAREETQKLEQMRRDFVANISHELRTPVTVIRGSLEALCDKVVDTPEKVADYHSQMLEEAKFLERLIGDLLDLSRLQNMNFAIEMLPVNICDVIEDASRSASRIAQQKDVFVSVQLQSACVETLGDYGRLRQMFVIVLDNAIKFSPQGAQVEIEVEEYQVIIRDHGCGIDFAHLPHIFERFYKTYGEQNKTGTGLGLAIAKQIADRHGILLSVANNSEGGTQFTFDFKK